MLLNKMFQNIDEREKAGHSQKDIKILLKTLATKAEEDNP